jgi:hypothetical protein
MDKTTVVPGTKEEFQAAQGAHDAAEAAFEQARQNWLVESIGRLFGFIPGLMEISVTGYTPGFNDGDPCYHHQCEAVINGIGREDEDEDEDEDEESEDAEYPILTEEEIDIVSSEMYRLSPLLEAVFGTDWKITIRREDDGISWKKEEYDCGY